MRVCGGGGVPSRAKRGSSEGVSSLKGFERLRMAQVLLFLSQVVTSQYSLLIARSSQSYSLPPFSVELSIRKCIHAHVSIAIFFSGSVIKYAEKKILAVKV